MDLRYKSIASAPLSMVINDFTRGRPELHEPLQGDLDRLDNILDTRGLGIVLLDFPLVGKLYDKALSSGRFDLKSLPPTLGSFKHRRCLFQVLLMESMDINGYVDKDIDPDTVFFTRTVFNLYKKLKVEPQVGSISASTKEFGRIEQELRKPTLDWGSPTKLLHELEQGWLKKPHSEYYQFDVNPALLRSEVPIRHNTLWTSLQIFERVAQQVMCKFPEVNDEELYPRHGPGSVADLKTGSDKYRFPNWPTRTEEVFPAAYFSSTSEEVYKDRYDSTIPGASEPSARLLAVPKTFKGPRLITAEPTALQFLQQGMRRWLREKLPTPLRHCINFKSQAPSREAALIASLDGKKATVDLSSASDRLSLWCVERVFRFNPGILARLCASRSFIVYNGIEDTDEFILVLRKYAGQGNATTFPVQSIVYALMAITAVLQERGNCRPTYKEICKVGKEVRIFGDDLILESRATPYLDLLLSYFQLKVNGSKTHNSGHFRESCGMDAYKGCEVTPLYMSRLLPGKRANDLVSWIDVRNNAHTKGLWSLSKWMEQQIPAKVLKLLPRSLGALPCLSLKSFVNEDPIFAATRQHAKWQVEVGRGLVPVTSTVTESRGWCSDLLDFFLKAESRNHAKNGYSSILPEPNYWRRGVTVKTISYLRKSWVHTKV